VEVLATLDSSFENARCRSKRQGLRIMFESAEGRGIGRVPGRETAVGAERRDSEERLPD